MGGWNRWQKLRRDHQRVWIKPALLNPIRCSKRTQPIFSAPSPCAFAHSPCPPTPACLVTTTSHSPWSSLPHQSFTQTLSGTLPGRNRLGRGGTFVKVTLRCHYASLRVKEEVKLSFQPLPCPRLISHPIMNLSHVAHSPSWTNSDETLKWPGPPRQWREEAERHPRAGRRPCPARPPCGCWGPAKAKPLARGCQLPQRAATNPHVTSVRLRDACGCPKRRLISITDTNTSLSLEACAPLHAGFKHPCRGSCAGAFGLQHFKLKSC